MRRRCERLNDKPQGPAGHRSGLSIRVGTRHRRIQDSQTKQTRAQLVRIKNVLRSSSAVVRTFLTLNDGRLWLGVFPSVRVDEITRYRVRYPSECRIVFIFYSRARIPYQMGIKWRNLFALARHNWRTASTGVLLIVALAFLLYWGGLILSTSRSHLCSRLSAPFVPSQTHLVRSDPAPCFSSFLTPSQSA